jgi:hypothetical protein
VKQTLAKVVRAALVPKRMAEDLARTVLDIDVGDMRKLYRIGIAPGKIEFEWLMRLYGI